MDASKQIARGGAHAFRSVEICGSAELRIARRAVSGITKNYFPKPRANTPVIHATTAQ
jgi:hypothetical protein